MSDEEHWIHLGRLYRQAFHALQRIELREYPVRREYPPTLSRDKSFRSSWPETEATRRIEAAGHIMLTPDKVRAGLDELKTRNFEAWLAVAMIDVRGLSRQQAVERLNTYRRHLNRLLEDGWAVIAEVIERGETP